MDLRDHAFAKAPYLLAAEDERDALLEGSDTLAKEAERPLVGDTEDDWSDSPRAARVIDPDVLWSCVTCGACVQQCPVDIEHVDHIVDMRRYQVLVESNFPAELNQLFKGMENKGNPWNMSADRAAGLGQGPRLRGQGRRARTIESLDEVEWLFWVGCAGAYEDRAKKTTRAVAELLDMAGVSFGVLGNGETCTGDSARRAGNEFVFQGLAQQNVETFKEHKVKKVVSTCAHCFNTLKNEYQEFGVELEVVHHTQLLNRLVREGRLTPVADGAGRREALDHLPRPVLPRPPQPGLRAAARAAPGAARRRVRRDAAQLRAVLLLRRRRRPDVDGGEHRRADQRQPHHRGGRTGADQIAVGCPFCRVMLSDGLTAEQADGDAREEVEVLDVAQMLLASVKGESATKAKKAGANGAPGGRRSHGGTAPRPRPTRRPRPSPRPATPPRPRTRSPRPPTSVPPPRPLAARPLFDVADGRPTEATEPPTRARGTPKDEAEAASRAGGSLFDLGGDDRGADAEDEPSPRKAAEPVETTEDQAAPKPEVSAGGSLFDIEADERARADVPGARREPRSHRRPGWSRSPTRSRSPRPAETTPSATPSSRDPRGRIALRHRRTRGARGEPNPRPSGPRRSRGPAEPERSRRSPPRTVSDGAALSRGRHLRGQRRRADAWSRG